MKLSSKKIVSLMLLCAVLAPVLVSAQQPLIPCTNDCDFDDLLTMINRIINWIILISVPVAAGVLAWAGFKLMTTGVVDQKQAAKNMIRKVLIGFVFILAAWIIVTTIINALLNPDFRKNIDLGINKVIDYHA